MANTEIFEIDNMDVDLKTYVKLRCKACLGDTVIFKFLVYDESSPVDLSQYKVEFRSRLPKSGVVYSEVDNVSVNGNELTVNCDSRLCSEIGEAIITLRLVDITTYKQKSNYLIVLKVMSTIDADEVIQSESILSPLESLDYAINRYLELKVDLNAEITLAETALAKLIAENSIVNTTILNAQQINTLLGNTYNTANLLNNDLKNNINSATNLNGQVQQYISDLNAGIAVAKYYNNELKTTVTSSQTLNDELEQENELATKQIDIMKQFGDINALITLINNFTIQQDSLSHLFEIWMQANPLSWTDDNGLNVTDDNGANIQI